MDTGTQRSQSLLVLTTRGEFYPTPPFPHLPSSPLPPIWGCSLSDQKLVFFSVDESGLNCNFFIFDWSS